MLLQLQHQKVNLKEKKIEGVGDNLSLPSPTDSASPAQSEGKTGSRRHTAFHAPGIERPHLSPAVEGLEWSTLCDGQGEDPCGSLLGKSSAERD